MSVLFGLHFLRPQWLLALIPLAAILIFHWRSSTRSGIWSRLVDAHLLPHVLSGGESAPSRLPLSLLAIGWLLLVIALAGPAWERLPQPVFGTVSQRAILLDLSPSMNAADVSPSRLSRARFEVLDLLRASAEGHVALLALGPEPFIVAPLSRDSKTVAAQVPQLATDLIPVPGPRRTDLALEQAADLLAQANASSAEVVLVTDGVGELAGALEAARALADAGHRLSVLAVGTEQGAPVPSANGGLMQNDDGSVQIAQLPTEQLRELAGAGGGRYVAASIGSRDTDALVAHGPRLDQSLEKQRLTSDQWREEGPWLILILLPLAALAFRRGWLLPALLISFLLPAPPTQALEWGDLWLTPDQRAARALAAGNPEAAAEGFDDAAWRAAASYRAGRYEQALDLASSLQGADAAFNRGNALARLGRLADAVAAYEDALRQRPDDSDARHNLDLVKRLLEQQSESAAESPRDGDRSESQGTDGQGSGGAGSESDSGSSQASQRAAAEDGATPEKGERDGSAPQTAESKHGGEDQAREGGESEPGGSGRSGDDGERTSARASGQGNLGESPGADDFNLDATASSGSEDPASEQLDRTPLDPATMEQNASQRSAKAEGVQPGDLELSSLSPQEREERQAMEAQLRRVPDDPAGLIRQRFLLQHLRREGRLP